MTYDIFQQALCGETITITEQQLIEAFAQSFDTQPYSFCCIADLQSWCDTHGLTLTISGTIPNIFTIAH
jgi:hypothetical protein